MIEFILFQVVQLLQMIELNTFLVKVTHTVWMKHQKISILLKGTVMVVLYQVKLLRCSGGRYWLTLEAATMKKFMILYFNIFALF